MSAPRNTAGHALFKDWKWLDDTFVKFFDWLIVGVYKVPGTGGIKTLLHGTWPLGHPLHPAITDITIGAYTAAFALDMFSVVTGDTTVNKAADFVFVVAFLSSLIAILSGLTDWKETFGEEKRTGGFHATLMGVATTVFLISIWMRLGGSADVRPLAVWLSSGAWALMLVGAFFGGELPYAYGTEVNRQAWNETKAKWQKLDVSASGLEDRKPVLGKTKEGVDVFVAKLDGTLYAMTNVCTHAGGPLNEGTWVGKDRCEIQCPWHGSVFCVKDGAVRGGPATFGEVSFEVRANEQGFVEVKARD